MRTMFGAEKLNSLKGGAVAMFYEYLESEGHDIISIDGAFTKDVDSQNEITLVFYRNPEGSAWKSEKMKQVQYVFTCQHAKDFSCSNTGVKKTSYDQETIAQL